MGPAAEASTVEVLALVMRKSSTASVRQSFLNGVNDALFDPLRDIPGLLVRILRQNIGRPDEDDRDLLRRLLGGIGHELERAQDGPVEIDVECLLVEHNRAEVHRSDVIEADRVPLAFGKEMLVVLDPLGQVLLLGYLELG